MYKSICGGRGEERNDWKKNERIAKIIGKRKNGYYKYRYGEFYYWFDYRMPDWFYYYYYIFV
jgi:hypothetical protein